MSKAKFTKLKWGIEKDEFDDSGEWFEIHASSEKHYISKHIADVYSGEGDAHLIAAAPEMYEMLETIKRHIMNMPLCDSFLYDWVDKAIDPLLSKARGEL